MMTISQLIQDRDVSFRQLVEQSNLEAKLVEAIVQGRYTPSPQQRQRLAHALGVSPDEIQWGHTSQVDHLYGHGPQFGRSP